MKMDALYVTVFMFLCILCHFFNRSDAQNHTASWSIRLADGLGDFEGRVEVFYNTWGTVCDNWWGLEEAEVVCKQLGFIGADLALVAGKYGPGEGDILLDMVQCNGTEDNLFECQHADIGTTQCNHAEDAGVVCTSLGSLRLNSGSVINEGRVEVRNAAGVWGTVCDDSWDKVDGGVACRQLGYPDAEVTFSNSDHPVTDPYFGPGTGPILLDGLECSGEETRLHKCPISKGWGLHDCAHSEDAGVRCKTQIVRLADGQNSDHGRVEVYYGGTWGTICNNQWDIEDANVVCRELGFQHGVLAATTVGGGSGPILLDDVQCIGNESSISECPTSGWAYSETCNHDSDVGVICNNPTNVLRLLSGSGTYEGVVEYREGSTRGLICDADWSINEAMVVCRQLGYQQGIKATPVTLGKLNGTIFNMDYRCNGDEVQLSDCNQTSSRKGRCKPEDIAQVSCGPSKEWDIRLVGSRYTEQGRLEVFLNDSWGSITDIMFWIGDGTTACRHLGYEGVAKIYIGDGPFGQGAGPIWISRVFCTDRNFYLSDCYIVMTGNTTENTHANDISVVCYPHESVANHPTRLISETGKVNNQYGRLEIFHDGVWGTVCDRYMYDADIVCAQLGHTDMTYADNLDLSPYGIPRGTGKIWIKPSFCSAYRGQDMLYKCEHEGWGITEDCTHAKDVGVTCIFKNDRSWNSADYPGTTDYYTPALGEWEIILIALAGSVPMCFIFCCCYQRVRKRQSGNSCRVVTATANYSPSTDRVTVQVDAVSTPPPEYVPPSPLPIESPPTYDSVSNNLCSTTFVSKANDGSCTET